MEEEILVEELTKQNARVHTMFERRQEKGFYEILVNRHLIHDESKFREFLRLNITQFNCTLDLVRDLLLTESSNRYQYPIAPEEKLAITLR